MDGSALANVLALGRARGARGRPDIVSELDLARGREPAFVDHGRRYLRHSTTTGESTP
jgi:hypothetical protein